MKRRAKTVQMVRELTRLADDSNQIGLIGHDPLDCFALLNSRSRSPVPDRQ